MGNIIAEAISGRWPEFELFRRRGAEGLPRPIIRSVRTEFSTAREYAVLEIDHQSQRETTAQIYVRDTAAHEALNPGNPWRRAGATDSGEFRLVVGRCENLDIRVQTEAGGMRSEFSQQVQYVSQQPLTPKEEREERREYFQAVVDRVTFPNYRFGVSLAGDALYLQITCTDVCNVTGAPMTWKSGKWLLSEHMLDSEVVQKCLKAVLTAVEHEAREQFKYRGRSIFDPHFDVERLWELRGSDGAVVQRSVPTPASASGPDQPRVLLGLPTTADISFARDDKLYELESQVAGKLRGSVGSERLVVSSCLQEVHSVLAARGRSWYYNRDGSPAPGGRD